MSIKSHGIFLIKLNITKTRNMLFRNIYYTLIFFKIKGNNKQKIGVVVTQSTVREVEGMGREGAYK